MIELKKYIFKFSNDIPTGKYNLDVTAIGSNDYGYKGSLPSIECRGRETGIYIITDKSVYRDSEKGFKIRHTFSYFFVVTKIK